MAQRKQLPDLLLKVLGSAVLAGILGIVAVVWAVYSSHSSDAVMKKQLENQATQLAKLDVQIDLSSEQNRLLSEQATVAAQKRIIETHLSTPRSMDDANFIPTATALAIRSSQIESTRQAIENKQKQIGATQTAIVSGSTQMHSGSCIPPDNLLSLHNHTMPPWSTGIYGSRNMLNFIVNVGEVNTDSPQFGEFQIWLDPCYVTSHGYKEGARFWPHDPRELPSEIKIPLGGEDATTIILPENSGIWGIGPP